MATKLLVCPECASEVAPGRFACTSCGALLAAVASVPRTMGWMESMTPPAVNPAPPTRAGAAVADAPEVHPSNGSGATIGPAWAHGPLERAPDETDLELAAHEGASDIDTAEAEIEPIREVGPVREDEMVAHELAIEAAPAVTREPVVVPAAPLDVEPAASAEPAQNIQFDGDAEVARDDAPLALPAATEATAAASAPVSMAPVEAIAAHAGKNLSETATEPSWPETRAWPPPGAAQPAPEPAPPPRAGAYLPPSAVLTTVGEPIEAATARIPGSPASVAAAQSSVGGAVANAASPASRSRRVLTVDPAFPPQAVVVGASIAALGFLMPWAPIVIGSTHTGGYLDQWGLAAPGHVALLLVIIALGGAASQVDRLPDWARPALPAVILSGIMIGLVWPYLLDGGFQPTIGVYLTLAAAIVLGVGGLLDLWVSRHAGESRAV
jgi:hypothetical protein